MTTKELTIGTKVYYKPTSFNGSKIIPKTSTVVGFYENYVCLENGDKMFRQALTILEDNTDRIAALRKKIKRYSSDRKNDNIRQYLEEKIRRLSK